MKRTWAVSLVVLLVAACSAATPAAVPPTGPIAPTAEPLPLPTLTAPLRQPPTPTAVPTAPPKPTAEPAEGGEARELEKAACWTAGLGGYDVDCYRLTVPEDRTQPEGRQVRLPVVVIHAKTSDPAPDPVIYLAPGGGFNIMPMLPFYLQLFGDRMLSERDLVFYNQRGAPLSEPSLQCPGYGALLYDLAREGVLGPEEQLDHKLAFLGDCHDDLVGQGIKLEMYDSAANAADAADLRVALGYGEANYYGPSYGALLGLSLLRDHPEGVRSIILDSVLPPQVSQNSDRAPNAHAGFSKLFAACAADPACSQAYPDLEGTFYRVINDLNAQPATSSAVGWEVSFDGGVFSEVIYGLLVMGQPGKAPRMIARAAEGDTREIEPFLAEILNAGSPTGLDAISAGVYYSIACREEVPFDSYEEALTRAADLPPALAEHFLALFPGWQFPMCQVWEVELADPAVNEPVVGDVPALILAGGLDPITPPGYGRLAAETLSNSFFFEFPGLGHGVMDADHCALEMGLDFLDDPWTAPDASCLRERPRVDFR